MNQLEVRIAQLEADNKRLREFVMSHGEDGRRELSAMPLSETRMCTRTLNALRDVGITTIGDLQVRSTGELRGIAKIGRGAMCEITDILHGYGIGLIDEIPDCQYLFLDKFELLWFMEGFVGKSHLRWDGYRKMVCSVWPSLSDKDREFVFQYSKRDFAWHFDKSMFDYASETPKKYFEQMLSRFDPSNQYNVTIRTKGGEHTIRAYKYNDDYRIGWSSIINPDAIIKVEQLQFGGCTNLYCKAREHCKRYLNKEAVDTDTTQFVCNTCDFFINADGTYLNDKKVCE